MDDVKEDGNEEIKVEIPDFSMWLNSASAIHGRSFVPLSKLQQDPLSYEYLVELEWLSQHVTSKASLLENVKKSMRSELPNADFIFSCTIDKKEDQPVMCNSVILTSSMSVYKREKGSCSSSPSFDAFNPEALQSAMLEGRVPRSTKAFVASSRSLRLNYGDFFETENPHVSLNFSQVDSIEYPNGRKGLLLLDPLMGCSVPVAMQNLRASSLRKGFYSPISPAVPESQQNPTTTGSQPVHLKKNRIRFCPMHSDSIEPSEESRIEDSTKSSKANITSWSWDKMEPLSLLALCSCHDEQLFKVWQEELRTHQQVCSKLTDEAAPSMLYADLTSIDWPAVRAGDFKSFFKDIGSLEKKTGSELQDLRFCQVCGGLPYIPFSFIEVCLNREFSTLTDIARKLPLPVPTDIFSDGLRLTVCFAAKTRLHEWLICQALKFVELDRTARVYQVCSRFVYPFHKVHEYGRSQTTAGYICPRHNLLISSLKLFLSAPPRFVQQQHRRPYCLSRRQPLTSKDLNCQIKLDWFEQLCFKWLEQQQAVPPTSIPSPIT